MPSHEPPGTTARRARVTLVPALVAIVAAVIVLGCRSPQASSSSAGSSVRATPVSQLPRATAPIAHHWLGEADGIVADDTTVYADVPAVTELDRPLLRALRQAASEAAVQGVTFYVESGWRSRAYQEQLFQEAVARYGSRAKAARWVAVPGTSSHEHGEAVDIGHAAAAAWLSRNGARYGLCQVYRNERWHFELRPAAVDHGCPRMYADPTHDPRMQP